MNFYYVLSIAPPGSYRLRSQKSHARQCQGILSYDGQWFFAPGSSEGFLPVLLFGMVGRHPFQRRSPDRDRRAVDQVLSLLSYLFARCRQEYPLWLLFHRVRDRKSTRLNSSHVAISYAVFCLK